MFFGTITQVEESIRKLFEEHAWHRTPIRFLVLDLALVAGVDLSAAEAFVRVQRLLASKRVVLVLCGFTVDSDVGRALTNVGLLEMTGVELFETFSDAMECEPFCQFSDQASLTDLDNVAMPYVQGRRTCTFVRGLLRRRRRCSQSVSGFCLGCVSQESQRHSSALPGRQDDVIPFSGSVVESPRRAALITAGWRTIARGMHISLLSNRLLTAFHRSFCTRRTACA